MTAAVVRCLFAYLPMCWRLPSDIICPPLPCACICMRGPTQHALSHRHLSLTALAADGGAAAPGTPEGIGTPQTGQPKRKNKRMRGEGARVGCQVCSSVPAAVPTACEEHHAVSFGDLSADLHACSQVLCACNGLQSQSQILAKHNCSASAFADFSSLWPQARFKVARPVAEQDAARITWLGSVHHANKVLMLFSSGTVAVTAK